MNGEKHPTTHIKKKCCSFFSTKKIFVLRPKDRSQKKKKKKKKKVLNLHDTYACMQPITTIHIAWGVCNRVTRDQPCWEAYI